MMEKTRKRTRRTRWEGKGAKRPSSQGGDTMETDSDKNEGEEDSEEGGQDKEKEEEEEEEEEIDEDTQAIKFYFKWEIPDIQVNLPFLLLQQRNALF